MGTLHAAGLGLDTPTPAQLKEFFAQVADKKVPPMRMQAIIRGVGRWDQVAPPPLEQIRLDWEIFYDVYFGIRVDLSRIPIPSEKHGFDRIIMIPQGLTLDAAAAACDRAFPCRWNFTPSEDQQSMAQRHPALVGFAVRVRGTTEADPDMTGVNPENMASIGVGILTMNLLERLVFELKYYSETGAHLDLRSTTLCTGSRIQGDKIPFVQWGMGMPRGVDKLDVGLRPANDTSFDAESRVRVVLQ